MATRASARQPLTGGGEWSSASLGRGLREGPRCVFCVELKGLVGIAEGAGLGGRWLESGRRGLGKRRG